MAKLKFVTCSIAILLALVTASFGQTSKGFVVGTITDPNAAAVPGVTVKITNTATGVTRETISQQDGSYRSTQSILEPTKLRSLLPDLNPQLETWLSQPLKLPKHLSCSRLEIQPRS